VIRHRIESRLVSLILYGSVAGILVFFYIPIFTLIAFSFREGRHLILPFDGVTLKWYGELFRHQDFGGSVLNSAVIALVATALSTVLGTGAAFAWVRYAFRLKRAFQGLMVMPLIFPQLLLGVVLLLWFSILGNWLDFSPGIITVIIGHVVYITPFVMIIVSVSIYTLDETLEDAARDCGASTWTVYREITLPLLWPAIFSAIIFAFLLSWGNFYITYNLAGTARTMPTFVFAGIVFGSAPLFPAVAAVTFVPGLVLVALAERFRRRATRAAARTAAAELAEAA
jgi:spermidine/putrescine transport system permease protein